MFVLAFDNTDNGAKNVKRNSHTKYFLPRVNINNYNALIDGRNFYDQPINDMIKQYDEIRKIATGQGDDYTTGCLLNYQIVITIYLQFILVYKKITYWLKSNSTNCFLWDAKS